MESLKLGDLLGEEKKEMVLAFTQTAEPAPGGYALTVHGGDFYVCLVSYHFEKSSWVVDKAWCYHTNYVMAFKAYDHWRLHAAAHRN